MVSLCGALEPFFTLADFAVLCALLSAPACADKLSVSPEALQSRPIYSGDFEAVGSGAAPPGQQPQHPIGYLLEAEALWWKIWCTSANSSMG